MEEDGKKDMKGREKEEGVTSTFPLSLQAQNQWHAYKVPPPFKV